MIIKAAVGTGPVHAAYEAIDALLGVPNTLVEFSINAVTEGIDALGEVTVRLESVEGALPRRTSPQNGSRHKRTFGGYGADTDIIVASAKAYLAAVNKMLVALGHQEAAETAVTSEPIS